MLEQATQIRGDDGPAIIRWRQHTWKSRALTWAVAVAAICYFAWVQIGIASGASLGLGVLIPVVFIVAQRLMRRWQVVVIKPRPQDLEDKRAYRRLRFVGFGMVLAYAVPFLWFLWDSADNPWHWALGGTAAAAYLGVLVGSPFLRRAYDRLFARIASKDGAYGF